MLPQDQQHVRGVVASDKTAATFYLKERSLLQADKKACFTNFSSQPQTEVNGQLHVLAAFLPADIPWYQDLWSP